MWERINIGVFLLWVVVLATMLLSARDTAAVTIAKARVPHDDTRQRYMHLSPAALDAAIRLLRRSG